MDTLRSYYQPMHSGAPTRFGVAKEPHMGTVSKAVLIALLLPMYYGHSQEALELRYKYKQLEEGVSVIYRGRATAFAVHSVETGTYLLTAAHSVANHPEIEVSGSAAQVVAQDKSMDIALLFTKLKLTPFAFGKDALKKGEAISIHGYYLDAPLRKYRGTIAQLGVRLLICRIPFDHGGSGAPVLDEQGNVVAMARSGCCGNTDGRIDNIYAVCVRLEVLRNFLKKHLKGKQDE